MVKIYVADVPDDITIMNWLEKKTDFLIKQNNIKPRNPLPELIALKIQNFDPVQLTQDIDEALSLYGDHGWKSKEGESKFYTGFSLVYNPDHLDNLDPHSSTLGTPKNLLSEFYYNTLDHHPVLKNSYFDSYGFNVATPGSKHKSLGTLMNRCKRTKIRSRLSIIHGEQSRDPSDVRQGWHKDEVPFFNLRINIPVLTTPNYFFELEDYAPVHLPVGYSYSWDNYKPHRVFKQNIENSRRIHLVLGFSPWWDYIPEEKAWVQNEFYGVKHPFDMLLDGDIFEGLTVDPNFSITLSKK